MRICLLTHVFPADAGDPSGVFVFELARGLSSRGHAVRVVTPWKEGASDAQTWDGVGVRRFRHRGRFDARLGELKKIPWPVMASFLAAWVGAALRAIREDELELIHAYWVVPGGAVGVLASRVAGVPVVASAPGTDLHTAPEDPVLRQGVRWTLRHLDALIALGEPLRARAVALGISPRRARVILNDGGTDPRFFRPSGPAPGAPGGPRRLLFVGRLARPKRVDTLLRMMPALLRRFPDATLDIVGDGEERPALAALAASLGCAGAIRFHGAAPHEQIPSFLDGAAALVYPSENEGLPSAIMEAMCFGVPVVSSPVGGIGDLLGQGRGVLVPPDDPRAFGAAVERLLSDAGARREIVERARLFAHREFPPERILRQIEAVYRDAFSTS